MRRCVRLALALAGLLLPTGALAQERAKPHNEELEQFLRQNQHHPEKVHELWKEMRARKERLLEAGKEDRAAEAAAAERRLAEWLEHHRAHRGGAGHDEPEVVLGALRAGIHALREHDRDGEAEVLARLAARIEADARERHGRAERDRDRGARRELLHALEEVERHMGEAREQGREEALERLEHKAEALRERLRAIEERGEGPPEMEDLLRRSEARTRELAERLEDLVRKVEKLARRVEEAERRSRR